MENNLKDNSHILNNKDHISNLLIEIIKEDSYVTVLDSLVRLEFVDTAGQEEYYALRDQWIQSCDMFIIGTALSFYFI